MKTVKKILIGLLVVFVIIQFIQPARNRSNGRSSTDLAIKVFVPENVQRVLQTACYDCHSNNTSYPWYSNVQPFGWLMAGHIRKGKAELNFSEFGFYSKRRQISKLSGISNSVRDGTMPLVSYLILHQRARLSIKEKALIIEWATKTKDSLMSQ